MLFRSLVEAEVPGGWELAVFGGFAVLLLLVLIGFWTEFSLIDRGEDPAD